MAKYLRIQIPKGCEENWDAMQDQQDGKFCNSCQNSVIDFTRMTDEQLVQFFKKRTDNVCGRFTSVQLNTDILISSKRIPWLKYFFRITIPAFLFSSKTIAQGKVKVQEHAHVSQPFKHAKKALLSNTLKRVPGIEPDENELANKILIKPEACQIKAGAYASPEPELQPLSGMVGGFSMVRIKKVKTSKPSVTSINKTFTIFPNPTTSSSGLNIKWNIRVSTNQTIQIYNEQGILLKKEIFILSKNSTQESFDLKDLQPGTYIIKVTDDKTHKSSSQQFIVQ